jgi:hypothetical protein
MGSAGIIRTILLVDIVVMALLALFYLRQRRLSFAGYFGWGLLALLIPVIGPFVVIAKRPGEWDPDFSLFGDFKRLGSFLMRMLPSPPNGKKVSRLDRARQRRKRKSQPGSRRD